MNTEICKKCSKRCEHFFGGKINEQIRLQGFRKSGIEFGVFGVKKGCLIFSNDAGFVEDFCDNCSTETIFPFSFIEKHKNIFNVESDCPFRLEHQLYDWNGK